jgi:hypothetical protein
MAPNPNRKTKVRSLAMDAWSDALLCFMRHAGNALNRRVWEPTYEASEAGSGAGSEAVGWMQRPAGPGNVEGKKAWCVWRANRSTAHAGLEESCVCVGAALGIGGGKGEGS